MMVNEMMIVTLIMVMWDHDVQQGDSDVDKGNVVIMMVNQVIIGSVRATW